MTTSNISLFQAMGAKMDYLNQRNRVLSQNIANADTPNYQPSDLNKVDFGRVLKNVTKSKAITMESTQPGHLPAKGQVQIRNAKEKKTYEVSPDKNGVSIEEQLMKSNSTQMDYTMMLNLYRNNVDMLRTAAGKGGQP